MNNKGQVWAIYGLVVFIAIILLFSILYPFLDGMDSARSHESGLNCPGVSDFDETDYLNDTIDEKVIRRPTCFLTGITPLYFIGSFLVSLGIWYYYRITGRKPR